MRGSDCSIHLGLLHKASILVVILHLLRSSIFLSCPSVMSICISVILFQSPHYIFPSFCVYFSNMPKPNITVLIHYKLRSKSVSQSICLHGNSPPYFGGSLLRGVWLTATDLSRGDRSCHM